MGEEAAGERVEQETASAVLPTVVSTTVMASGTLVREEPALGSSHLFATGTEVVIQGLLKHPEFNGQLGVVQSVDEAMGRYNILVALPAGGHCWAKVKHDNLRPTLQALPPSFAPTLDDGSCIPSLPSTPTWEEGCGSVHRALQLTHAL